MIALDMGGTKTSILFNNKEMIDRFLRKYGSAVIDKNYKQKYVVMKSEIIRKNKKGFDDFINFLKKMDDEIITTFPGTVNVEKEGHHYRFKVFSFKFPFLMNQYLDVNFVINDVYAFAYYHAYRFFKDPDNKRKTILVIQMGTGINALHFNYYDFKQLLLLNKKFEAGHITINLDGEQCPCGRKGCAEVYLGGERIKKMGKGDPKQVFRDAGLRKIYYGYLVPYVSSLVLAFSPDKIVFGGSAVKELDIMHLHKGIEASFPHFRMHLNIEYEKDDSFLSSLRGLVALYERFNKLRDKNVL